MSLLPSGSQIQDQVAADYTAQFNRALSVSVMQKLRKFPMLQELGFNGHLSYLGNNFHGLADFKKQLELYSNTNIILTIAWRVISAIVPKNQFIRAMLFQSPSLGSVGKLFLSLHNFDQVFGVSSDDVLDRNKIGSQITGALHVV